MKNTILTLACIAGTSLLGNAAFAGCSEAELQAKVLEVNTAVQELATTDIEKMQEVMAKMQESAENLDGADDADAACNFYDEILTEINS